jgi:small subunit ribosomal protein S6
MHPRRYETLILLSPNLNPVDLDKFKDKIQGILDQGNAKIVLMEDWGRKMLAYPVHKEHYGIYLLYDYQAMPEVESEIKRNLKIDENVFKSLTLVLDRQFTDERYEKEREKALIKIQKREAQAEAEALRLAQEASENQGETNPDALSSDDELPTAPYSEASPYESSEPSQQTSQETPQESSPQDAPQSESVDDPDPETLQKEESGEGAA